MKIMENLSVFFKRYFANKRRRKFYRYGLPFMLMVLGGAFGLKNFQELRFDLKQNKKQLEMKDEAMRKYTKKKEMTEEEMVQELLDRDIDNWEIIRGPRDGEDSKTIQDEQRKRLKELKEKSKQS